MLHTSRFVWMRQTHCTWFEARRLSQSKVIAQKLLVTFDDLIWPETHVAEVTGQKFCLNPQVTWPWMTFGWHFHKVCEKDVENVQKKTEGGVYHPPVGRGLVHVFINVLNWPSITFSPEKKKCALLCLFHVNTNKTHLYMARPSRDAAPCAQRRLQGVWVPRYGWLLRFWLRSATSQLHCCFPCHEAVLRQKQSGSCQFIYHISRSHWDR